MIVTSGFLQSSSKSSHLTGQESYQYVLERLWRVLESENECLCRWNFALQAYHSISRYFRSFQLVTVVLSMSVAIHGSQKYCVRSYSVQKNSSNYNIWKYHNPSRNGPRWRNPGLTEYHLIIWQVHFCVPLCIEKESKSTLASLLSGTFFLLRLLW